MAIEKVTKLSRVSVNFRMFCIVEIEHITQIFEDGHQIGSDSYHGTTLNPGADLADVDPIIAAHCALAWTPEVIKEWQAWLSDRAAAREALVAAVMAADPGGCPKPEAVE